MNPECHHRKGGLQVNPYEATIETASELPKQPKTPRWRPLRLPCGFSLLFVGSFTLVAVNAQIGIILITLGGILVAAAILNP